VLFGGGFEGGFKGGAGGFGCCVGLGDTSSSSGTVAAEQGCLLFFFFFKVFLSCDMEVPEEEGSAGPMSLPEVDPDSRAPDWETFAEEDEVAPFSTEVEDVEAVGGMGVFT